MACKTRKLKRMPIGGVIQQQPKQTSGGASVGGVMALAQAGQSLGEGIRTGVEGNYNTNTGEFNNPGAVKTFNVLGHITNPWKVFEKNGKLSPKDYVKTIEADRAYDLNKQYRQQYDTSMQPGGGMNQINNTPLMPMGGIVPGNQETVELEKGEPFMSPDGQINKISDQAPTHAQGGVPITLSSGTKVLGKKPATDEKTFKQLGAKLERQQTKYQKILSNKPSKIAEDTATRMLAKVDKQFNELFELQGEDTQATQQFPKGGLIGNGSNFNSTYGYTPEQVRNAQHGEVVQRQALKDPNTGKIIAYEQYMKGISGPQYSPVEKSLNNSSALNNLKPVKEFATGGGVGFGDPNDTQNILGVQQEYEDSFSSREPINFNANTVLNTAGAIAPMAYNLYQGMQKPDQVATNAFKNPYESEVRATMRGRRYNIQPEIEANRLTEATHYRNLKENAPTQAQYLGGMQANAISTQRAIGQTLARKQNADNQYLSEQAQVDMSLGQADSQRQQYVEDINARSSAVQDQFTTSGLAQLGQYAQVRQQMNNQMVRDAQRLNLLPALVQNFQLNENGEWVYKQTGEVVDNNTVMEYVKGNNIK